MARSSETKSGGQRQALHVWKGSQEPLSRISDVEEFAQAYRQFKAGQWDDERWTAFRLRFGVYGQLHPGVQMIRIKVPGGIASLDWLRAVARLNRKYCQGSDIHITTRQDFQVYHVPLERTPEFIADLAEAGMTTREACGNTLRNMNGCQLAGVCPREHTDADKVAAQLAHSWLRSPLTQHMPRKFKVSVSGCETDCAASAIHDLGLVATKKNAKQGFIVFAGGGTGGQAIAAVKVADFIEEHEIPAVLESLLRLHQRYSNRINRNAARIKFLVKRFGPEKFRALFEEEYARLKDLPQRPWAALAWREPTQAPEPLTPGGVVHGHDGKTAVVVSPRLGLMNADQLEQFAAIAEKHGSREIRLTRDQNFVIMGLEKAAVSKVVSDVRGLGFAIEENPGDVADVVSCPGTTSCRIGITNSQNFGDAVAEEARNYAAKPGLSVRISGCQNGCGLHHVGDFGFRGMGKKIEGKNAPHYQVYVGGNPRQNGAIGLAGPIIPARLGPQALKALMDGYALGRKPDEEVREWGERLGKEGLAELLAPILSRAGSAEDKIYVDWGEDHDYAPPAAAKSECAATFAVDNLLRDLADDALISTDRALAAKNPGEARRFGREGIYYAARRLLVRMGDVTEGEEHGQVLSKARAFYAGDEAVLKALGAVVAAEESAQDKGAAEAALSDFREALAFWVDLAADLVAKPVAMGAPEAGALGDSKNMVADILRAQNRSS